MLDLTTHLTELSLATGFGAAGLSAQLVWPLFRGRTAILGVQLAASCSYSASYAFAGHDTAAAICLIGAVQTTVALIGGDRPWLSRIGYIFLPVVLIAAILTYSGLPSLLAATACCLIMLGRLQRDTLRLRAVQLGASPFGAAHDLIVGAWPCLAGALLSFLIAATALRREMQSRRAVPAAA